MNEEGIRELINHTDEEYLDYISRHMKIERSIDFLHDELVIHSFIRIPVIIKRKEVYIWNKEAGVIIHEKRKTEDVKWKEDGKIIFELLKLYHKEQIPKQLEKFSESYATKAFRFLMTIRKIEQKGYYTYPVYELKDDKEIIVGEKRHYIVGFLLLDDWKNEIENRRYSHKRSKL